VSQVHTPAQMTATAPSTITVVRGPRCSGSAAQPVTSAETVIEIVMSAKSNEKIRPRMWSGTMRCKPYDESVHWAPPPRCAIPIASAANHRLGINPSSA
jgi:hypothetical protein